MELMKNLLNKSATNLAESPIPDNWQARRRFGQVWPLVERDAAHLEAVFKDGGAFTKTITEAGGDPAYIKAIKHHLDQMMEALDELHMSTGMAMQTQDDEARENRHNG